MLIEGHTNYFVHAIPLAMARPERLGLVLKNSEAFLAFIASNARTSTPQARWLMADFEAIHNHLAE